MEEINRRGFLKSTVTTTGILASSTVDRTALAAKNANDRINVAVVGIRNRGRDHYRTLAEIPNVRIAALCDVDERLFPKAVTELEELTGYKPKTVVDYGRILDDRDIHAVSIASPDHWHALHTIWACQAGKDVYIEKPISYTIDEGRMMVKAARKYNRVVQVGTQSRSSQVVKKAVDLLRDGELGEIYMGRAIVFGFRPNIGRVKDSPVPNGVHWDLFLGPAPYRPFNENRFHYKWHWFWDTSTTEFGNNATHHVDRIRWGMGKRVHPVSVYCDGDFFCWDSDQEIPNIQIATYRYEDGSIVQIEVRSLYTNPEAGEKSGSLFYGSKGWMHLSHTEFKTFLGSEDEPGPKMSVEDLGTEFKGLNLQHFTNFIDCVRSRRWQDLNADISEGHMSTAIMHMGNIAFQTGRKLHFNPHSEKFINDDDANSYLTREYRYPYALPKDI